MIPLLTDRRFLIVKQDLTKVSAELSQMLLGPVANQLGKKRLVIVSDGALYYVPLAALPIPALAETDSIAILSDSATPLLVKHEVVSHVTGSAMYCSKISQL